MPHLPLLLFFSSFFQTSRPYPSPDFTQAPFPLDTPAPSAPWDPPSPNSTDHLIFSSVSSLLHTWHNTRYRNGHTIVPGTIPKGTLLHHGTSKKQLPTTPEWTALDPEFSYMFCHTAKKTEVQGNGKDDEGGPTGGEGCWHLTLRTTRPLNILYFDGSSAAKTYGSLDAQDLIVFGNDLAYDGTDRDSPSRVFDESERLRRLCQWGRKYQLDGFVRMQSSFEVMLCDFTVGVEEISFLNLVSDLERAEDSDEDDKEERDGPAEPDQPTLLKVYGSIDVGLRHGSSSSYSSPETRVHLDFTRLISFYDTSLFPSLADGREKTPSKATSLHNSYSARNRFQKGLLDTQLIRGTWRVGPIGGISEADRERLMGRLDEILKIDRPLELGGTEVDWVSLYRQVKDRYAERLEILYHILSSSADSPGSRRKSLLNARAYVDTLLTPYVLYGLKPSPPPSLPDDPQLHAWAAPVLEHCSNHFVPSSSYALTPSERTLVSGLRGTTREICRVLVHLWALGAESDVGLEGISALSSSQIRDLHETYLVELTSLVSWLDWSTPWIRCPSTPSHPSSFILSDGCSFEETCYFPTWPFFHNLDPVIPGLPMRNWPSKPPTRNASDLPPDPPARRGDKDSDVDTSEWLFPQPRCIRRIFPLHLP